MIFKLPLGEVDVAIRIQSYVCNGKLAIEMGVWDEEIRAIEAFGTLTVNLPDFDWIADNEAFLDTNNYPYAENFVRDHKLAVPTGRMARSGYCLYPLYRFDLERLRECEKDGWIRGMKE